MLIGGEYFLSGRVVISVASVPSVLLALIRVKETSLVVKECSMRVSAIIRLNAGCVGEAVLLSSKFRIPIETRTTTKACGIGGVFRTGDWGKR
jgi:hypothetical protein